MLRMRVTNVELRGMKPVESRLCLSVIQVKNEYHMFYQKE